MKSKGQETHEVETMMVDATIIERMHARGEIVLTEQQFKQLDGRPFIEMPTQQYENSRMKTPRREVVWIDPLDAVHILAPKFGGDANAKSALLERLRDAAIECTMGWLCIQSDVGPLPHQRPRQSATPNGPQEAQFVTPLSRDPGAVRMGSVLWNKIEDFARDAGRWNWGIGLFVASYHAPERLGGALHPEDDLGREYRERMVASDVRFNKQHVERMLGATASSDANNGYDAASHDKLRNGKRLSGPKRSMDWDHWVAEVIIQVRMNAIELDQSNQEFHDEIVDILHSKKLDAPDYSKVSRTISAIKNRWREAEKSGELRGRRLS